MNNISKVFSIDEKLACITLDFETDYGDRIGEFNILNEKEKLAELGNLFSTLNTPVSAFIRTDMLMNYPASLDILKLVATDYHSHSHTHDTKAFNSKTEFTESMSMFEEVFGYKPLGYRAPQGVLFDGDIELLKEYGFKFSSSVFPSYRPGKFNNISFPIDPFIYDNGIIELPFSVVPTLRYVISLSYLKLAGMSLNKALFSMFGLPNIVIFDSHLHDYIVNKASYSKLPQHLQIAWGINKNAGMKYFEIFVNILKEKGYQFITMTDLYNRVKETGA